MVAGGTVLTALIAAGQTISGLTRHLPLMLSTVDVQGWSTVQSWRGVRLGELAVLAGVSAPRSALVSSPDRKGCFNRVALQANQIGHPDAMIALQLNGADISLDHRCPARIIIAAPPGVHTTKWVSSIDFRAT